MYSILTKNLKSAVSHKPHDQLLSIIQKEVHVGRMSGPFLNPPMANLRFNPVGVLPKKMVAGGL